MKGNRKLYLDNIRWITVVIVVVYHVIYMFNGVQTFGVLGPFREKQWQDGFQYLVYPWFMALLFVVSGMSSRYYLENHDDKVFRKDRTRKLLVPSTIGLFVFQWTVGYYNMLIAGAFESFAAVPKPIIPFIVILNGTGPLWYIQMLWIFSVLLTWIRKVEKDRLYQLAGKVQVWMLVLAVVLLYGSAQILTTPVVSLYRFGIYGFCFFTGYFVFAHDEVIEQLTKYWIPLVVVALLLGIAYLVIYFGENYAIEPYINNCLACAYCWFAILAILSFMKKFADKTCGVAQWIGKKAWALYLFHYLPLSMVAYYLHLFAPEMNPFLVYLLVGISAFTGGILIGEIISRIPWVRWCVMGISKKKSKEM